MSGTAPDALKPVYGIWGDDRGKVDRAVRRLQDRVIGDGGMPAEVFDASLVPGSDVVAACETLSFGGLRLVLVRGCESWRADDAAPVVEYLGAPNPGTCLAIVADGAVTPKLKDAIAGAGQVLSYGPDAKARRADRTKWFVDHVQAECDRAGAKLPPKLARTVVDRVGEDAMALSREAEKLAAAAGREPIDGELVEALVVANPEAKAYALADAIVAGQRPRVFRLLGELASGDRPTDPAVVHSTLTRHFRGIAVAQALGARATPDAVGEATGLRGYPAQKAVEHARAIPAGVGDRCVSRLAMLELDLRVSSLAALGRTNDDGRRFVLEHAARDLVAMTRDD
jgi:DNA polymerase III delta subunit